MTDKKTPFQDQKTSMRLGKGLTMSLLQNITKKCLKTALALTVCIAAPLPALAQQATPDNLTVVRSSEVGAYKEVKLGLDKSLVVEVPRDVRDILVANPEVADAIVRTSRKVFLIGNKVGQTSVFMFDGAGNQILNLSLKVERDAIPLEALFKKYIPGSNIVVEVVNDNIVLTGTVPNPLASRRAAQIANAFVTGGEATTGAFTQSVSGSTGSGGGISGAAISNPDSQGRAVSQIINLLQIEADDQVHLKVIIAEVKRSVLKQLGVDISSTGGSGSLAANIFKTSSTGVTGLPQGGGFFAQLINNDDFGISANVLEKNSVMRILAEPSLTAISGQEANFLVGGSYRVPDSAEDNEFVSVQQEYGISLAFQPIVQSPERITLRLSTEVSDVDYTVSQTVGRNAAGSFTFPGLTVRRASSTVELPSGGTMVIAGLLQDDIRQAVSGVPYLQNVPILGPLFGSKEYLRNETELVIAVTPYLVKPTSRNKLVRPDKNFIPPADGPGFFMNRLNRIYGRNANGTATGKFNGRVGFIYE